MGVGERQPRRKTASFSSSLLDAIYHSIDDKQEAQSQAQDFLRRNNAPHVEQEIESLRRAIMVEKWMENYSSNHIPSLSTSSTDSSIFSSSETESSSLPKPRKESRTILKKPKDNPISPRGRIASFLNSIFSPRNLKKNQVLEEWNSVRKSRSMKDTSTRSCLNKTPTSTSKSKRSVRFCPAVSVIADRQTPSAPTVGSQFIKKNIDSFRQYEGKKNQRKHEFRNYYENESDVDDKSCASSDLFELDSIARIGIGAYEEELPVYGTTNLKKLIM